MAPMAGGSGSQNPESSADVQEQRRRATIVCAAAAVLADAVAFVARAAVVV